MAWWPGEGETKWAIGRHSVLWGVFPRLKVGDKTEISGTEMKHGGREEEKERAREEERRTAGGKNGINVGTEWCHCEAAESPVCFLWQCADCSVFQQLSPSPVNIERSSTQCFLVLSANHLSSLLRTLQPWTFYLNSAESTSTPESNRRFQPTHENSFKGIKICQTICLVGTASHLEKI